VLVADVRAETLADIAAGKNVDLDQARKHLDAQLLEPPLSAITDPKQRVIRMLKGA